MASVSKAQRQKRRVKRTNSLLKRALRNESAERYKAHVILLSVLAQQGGEVTVQPETITQTMNNVHNLAFAIEPNAEKTASVIRLVTVTKPATEVDPGRAVTPSMGDLMENAPEGEEVTP